MANPNLDLLIAMARAMGPLCEQVVFVGGCATGLLVDNAGQMDLVPLDEKVLGFANPWYRVGFEAALSVELADGLRLRHLSVPHFLATKFEAFKDRGQNDVYLSHDLEDIMTVMEGRSTVVQELAAANKAVRKHVGQSVTALLEMPTFHNALPGLLSEPGREQSIKTRLMQIAQSKDL